MLRRVALVRTDVSEELSASIIRVTRMGEPGTNKVLIILGQNGYKATGKFKILQKTSS
jgi:hypothetical protein